MKSFLIQIYTYQYILELKAKFEAKKKEIALKLLHEKSATRLQKNFKKSIKRYGETAKIRQRHYFRDNLCLMQYTTDKIQK